MSPYHILLLEDDDNDAELTLMQLRHQLPAFEYERAVDRQSFVSMLAKNPQVILADYQLPQFNALDALFLLKELKLDIPLIIVSGTIGEETAVEAIRKGAYDYLLKDRLGRLGQAVQRAIDESNLLQQKKQIEGGLRESEARYRSLFRDSPVSLWEEDFSSIRQAFEHLASTEIGSLEDYFDQNPQELRDIIKTRRINDINQATLHLYQGEDKLKAIQALSSTFSQQSFEQFRRQLLHFWRGEHRYQCETTHFTLKGHEIFVSVTASIAPGYENSWGKVFTSVVDLTAGRAQEQALQESEQRYQYLFNAIGDGILLLDAQGNILNANQANEDLLGYPLAELLPMNVLTLEAGMTPEQIGARATQIYQQERLVFKSIGIHKSGRQIPLEVTTTAVEYEGKQAALAIIRDISQRLAAERALRESQELLSTILEADPNGIFITDDQGRYTLVNRAGAQSFGLSKEQILGANSFELARLRGISPSEVETFHQQLMEVIRDNTTLFIPEDRVYSVDGSSRWYETRLIPLKNQGLPPMVLGVSNDVTERKQIETQIRQINEILEERVRSRTIELQNTTDALRSTNEKLQAILDNSPDGILMLTPDGIVEMANRELYHHLDLREEEVLGKPLHQLPVICNYEQFFTHFQDVVEENGTRHFEIESVVVDQRRYDLSVALSPVLEEGMMKGVVCSLHDISELKMVQRMKDAFVSNVSHELRTPITNFVYNLELLRMRPDRSQVYIDRLEKEVLQLKELIDDLLHLSRFDQGAISLRLKTVDLNRLCASFVDLRSTLATQKGLEITFAASDQSCRVEADEGLVSQVLSIFLTNAINYTPSGGNIHVQVLGEASRCGFSVIDTGPGISQEEAQALSQRFYRGSVGRNSGVPGTGLGLSIAREILDLHQGRLEISNQGGREGTGACFTAWIPCQTG